MSEKCQRAMKQQTGASPCSRLESVRMGRDPELLDDMLDFYAPTAKRIVDVCCNRRKMWKGTRWGGKVIGYDINPEVLPDVVSGWHELPDMDSKPPPSPPSTLPPQPQTTTNPNSPKTEHMSTDNERSEAGGWTRNKPKERGWYWLGYTPRIVKVWRDDDGKLYVNAESPGWPLAKRGAWKGCKWAGPILPPNTKDIPPVRSLPTDHSALGTRHSALSTQ